MVTIDISNEILLNMKIIIRNNTVVLVYELSTFGLWVKFKKRQANYISTT